MFICIKMDLALNNLKWLICHKTKLILKKDDWLRTVCVKIDKYWNGFFVMTIRAITVIGDCFFCTHWLFSVHHCGIQVMRYFLMLTPGGGEQRKIYFLSYCNYSARNWTLSNNFIFHNNTVLFKSPTLPKY